MSHYPANPQVTDEMIYAGAQVLRERDMAGRITVPWDKIPNGQKKKWQERSLACLTAALADHVVVPREPTTQQTESAGQAIATYVEKMAKAGGEVDALDYALRLVIYRAMISAAPLPQKEG